MEAGAPGRGASALASATVILLLAGCTGVSQEPVPTEAEAPYVCDGVPLRGLELMTGSTEMVVGAIGISSWGDEFVCAVDGESTSTGSATISRQDENWRGSGVVESYLAADTVRPGLRAIDADAPGDGYVDTFDGLSALWICPDGIMTEVRLHNEPEVRDAVADLERYMISILPWACGDQEVPPRTVAVTTANASSSWIEAPMMTPRYNAGEVQ